MFKNTILSIILLFIFNFASGILANEFELTNSATFPTNKFLPVNDVYKAEILSIHENGTIDFIWVIEPKHYLYRHGFKIEWFSSQHIQALDNEALALDKGIIKEDPYFGQVEAYYSSVDINLPIALNEETIYIKASSQGCADAGLCYPPYSLFFSISPDKTVQQIDKGEFASKKAEYQWSSQTTQNNQVPTNLIKVISILLLAFLGGIILNLMPCVLPILSLKVFQMADYENKNHRQNQGIAYLAGVVLSFLAVAFIMISLRAAGDQIGWGFQLQNPWFITFLIYLFFVLGLSLSGFINIGAQWMGAGQALTTKSGTKGSFFTGVLAVVVASPCTAPFMGTALGFAATQPTWIALLVFFALGTGMALPLTLICFIPSSAKWLPKQGAWMETIKEFFAFPLYLTAIWLLWVLGKQTGVDGMSVAVIGCLLIFVCIWLFKNTSLATKVAGFTLFILIFLTIPLPSLLHNYNKKPAHIIFTQEKLDQMRKDGKAVFVDLTADWCITCKTNEATTLNTSEVQNALKEANITYMIGDWTNANPEITTLLNQYNRNGIPLYLLYPPTPMEPAIILPQILTKGIVLEAISTIQQGHK